MTSGLALIFGVQAVVGAVLAGAALDVYAHKRVEHVGGVNVWGYRGATARQKTPNEIRVAAVGGTLAFGWGVAASETMIETVRQLVALALDRPGQPATRVTAINLGAIGLPLSAYATRLARFADLELDVVCVYPDVTEQSSRPPLPPQDSVIDALTGYSPILPLVLQEKAPRLRWRLLETLVGTTGRALRAADRAAHGLVVRQGSETTRDPLTVIEATVEHALGITHGVVVVVPVVPFDVGTALESLEERIVSRFGGDDRVRVVDAGRDPRLHEPGMRLDADSFGAGGNALVGEAVTPAVLELLAARSRSSSLQRLQ
jgi:hypothetical protein